MEFRLCAYAIFHSNHIDHRCQYEFRRLPETSIHIGEQRLLAAAITNAGDRLVFSNGILVLGVLSVYFLALKRGNVDALIPLFMIGVFISFTLSQLGMVKHWFTHKGDGWQRKAVINGIGGVFTGVVFVDILLEKFLEGAWIVVLIIVALLFLFQRSISTSNFFPNGFNSRITNGL